ncbi:hypothetical protein ABIA33_007213, partial [Streptacidiphilus sp. MAP12-16]
AGGGYSRDDRGGSGSRSFGDRDNRSADNRSGGFQRRDDRPSAGGGSRSFGDRPAHGDRPSYGGSRPTGDRNSRPAFGRRDDHRPAGGGSRSFGDRDSRPGGFQRRDDRGGSSYNGGSTAGGDRNKPRWKN